MEPPVVCAHTPGLGPPGGITTGTATHPRPIARCAR
jgi:hypothetical protein